MKRVIIVGGGRSIKNGIELGLWDKIKDEEVWSINYAFKSMPYLPKRQLWVDTYFFRNNIETLQELANKGVSCHAKKHSQYVNIPQIVIYECTRENKGILNNNGKLFIGRMGLSGYFALNLATQEEYNEIFLLGYDFGSIDNTVNTHFYQGIINVKSTGVGHPELYRSNKGGVKSEVEDFNLFKRINSKIYNVSPLSNIATFEKIDYSTFFEKINKVVRCDLKG